MKKIAILALVVALLASAGFCASDKKKGGKKSTRTVAAVQGPSAQTDSAKVVLANTPNQASKDQPRDPRH